MAFSYNVHFSKRTPKCTVPLHCIILQGNAAGTCGRWPGRRTVAKLNVYDFATSALRVCSDIRHGKGVSERRDAEGGTPPALSISKYTFTSRLTP